MFSETSKYEYVKRSLYGIPVQTQKEGKVEKEYVGVVVHRGVGVMHNVTEWEGARF